MNSEHDETQGACGSAARSLPAGPDAERGYVMLIVLTGVFALSVIALASMAVLRAGTDNLQLASDRLSLEVALHNAEQRALYELMTGTAVSDGVVTGTAASGLDLDETLAIPDEGWSDNVFWSARGGGRTYRFGRFGDATIDLPDAPDAGESSNGLPDRDLPLSVRAHYWDVSAFLPLSTAEEAVLAQVLAGMGVAGDPQSLAAKLADYVDPDHQRRFRGAERADYRFRGLPPPANAPLRLHEEVFSILDWPSAMTPEHFARLRAMTTLMPSAGVNANFLRPELADILDEALEDEDGMFGYGVTPGPVFRIELEAAGMELNLMRAIDVQLSPMGVIPFTRQKVYQRPLAGRHD